MLFYKVDTLRLLKIHSLFSPPRGAKKRHQLIDSENITYKRQPENDLNGKILKLHRNMLLSCDNLLDIYSRSINGEDWISNHKNKEHIKSKSSDTHTERKYRVKNVTQNESRK